MSVSEREQPPAPSRPDGEQPSALRRRLERERKARIEAEAIAEKVTGQLYSTVQELTRVNQDLQALNQSMRDFISVASHDLRTPLTSILGFASMMTSAWDAIPDERKHHFVSIMERQATNLTHLVDDLLTVSRIETAALDVHREVVELSVAAQQSMETFTEHMSEIRLALPADLAILADPDHVQRILTNYVANALKYGSPPIEVAADETDGWIDIRVSDSGDGVPPEFVPHLFERFARADAVRNAQPGTGLGLSIVKGLAEANGGEAWYEPGHPHGSCFIVRLPKAAA